jgi:deoxycytidylate deaminase
MTPKLLDYCRALHAEERAMLNLARSGANYGEKATLYTTTFTCNMCANKVVELGISEVVYSEPYPIKEAMQILSDANIRITPYQGVTHKGYFRLMEDNR